MRKNYVLLATFVSMLAFTACSSDETPFMEGGDQIEQLAVGEDFIEIAVSNTGVGTRAVRPLGSSAAANSVNKVQLKFYKKVGSAWQEDTTVKVAAVDGQTSGFTGNVLDFSLISSERPTQKPQPQERHVVKLQGLTTSAEYRLVAYGYNDDPAAAGFPYGAVTDDKSGVFSVTSNKTAYQIEEVFAGFAEKKTTDTGKFQVSPVVTLTRQVAGMLAYFNIPGYANGEKVEVVKVIASDQATGFKFPNTLITPSDFNGVDTNGDGEDVLMTFTMKNCAANYASVPMDGYYTADTKGVTKPYADGYAAIAPAKLALAKDAFFGARFVLPYDADLTTQTLKVVMYGANDKVLKTLKVKTNVSGQDPYAYDIRCNNFYSIGKKMSAGTITGQPDPNPDPAPDPQPQPEPEPQPQPDPDKPIDLGLTEQIVVEINDAWEVLHNMGVEE